MNHAAVSILRTNRAALIDSGRYPTMIIRLLATQCGPPDLVRVPVNHLFNSIIAASHSRRSGNSSLTRQVVPVGLFAELESVQTANISDAHPH